MWLKLLICLARHIWNWSKASSRSTRSRPFRRRCRQVGVPAADPVPERESHDQSATVHGAAVGGVHRRYGCPEERERRFGVTPQQIFTEDNRVAHVAEYEGQSGDDR
ncbi:hypothetical protein [Nonomuraea jiangxiensis]|uniref:hypothetical protein n=1 Tax=Nonomuraea jiangxiensis TaxID=633440 RepID=UPI00115F8DA2|nr:hypothetical protein [Nonomuraea jiangxiensis]